MRRAKELSAECFFTCPVMAQLRRCMKKLVYECMDVRPLERGRRRGPMDGHIIYVFALINAPVLQTKFAGTPLRFPTFLGWNLKQCTKCMFSEDL